MVESTIAAIATPVGVGGIGIIRISGESAFSVIDGIFVPKNDKIKVKSPGITVDISSIKSHRLYYGHIIEPLNNNIIDEVLVVFMKAPNTYTTEDVVEIQAHSGFVVLNRLLSIVLKNGAIMAEVGEFTKRAFLNGRIDLTQAEGVIDLINAKSDKVAQFAAKQIKGLVKFDIELLKSMLLKLLAKCDGMIEFVDESDEFFDQNIIYDSIRNDILPIIKMMIIEEKNKILYRDGVNVVIVGATNVGKSSLMNRMVNNHSSIVTSIPGTTRDILKDYILIKGLPIILYDTAGLRDTKDHIEMIGMQKSKNEMNKADIILFVIDACKGVDIYQKKLIYEHREKKIILVVNKIDLCNEDKVSEIEQEFSTFKVIGISAKQNLFISQLKKDIFNCFVNSEVQDGIGIGIVLNSRFKVIFEKVKNLLDEILISIEEKLTIDVLSYQIGDCVDLLRQVSGLTEDKEFYEDVFSRFCIGK